MTAIRRQLPINDVLSGGRNATPFKLDVLLSLLRLCTTLSIPLLFIVGIIGGTRVGLADYFNGWSQSVRFVMTYGSWIPLVVLTGIWELLRFNRTYFWQWIHYHSSDQRESQMRAAAETGLLLLAVACAWCCGIVFGRVWTLQPFFYALVICSVSLLILWSFYYSIIAGHFIESPEAGVSEDELKEAEIAAALAPCENDTEAYSFHWTLPEKGLDSLAGMADLKREIREAIAGFKNYSVINQTSAHAQANTVSVSERNGILLYGPAGNGKTSIAQAMAAELGLPFVKVGAADLTTKWINESPQLIRELFRQASLKPCVLFFDEFDSVATRRDSGSQHSEDRKVVNTLLSAIDSARNLPIVVLAATNFMELIDGAIARDGRFDFRIEIPYPDQLARLSIIRDKLDEHKVLAPYPVLEQVAGLWEQRSISFICSALLRVRDLVRADNRLVAHINTFKQAALEAGRKPSLLPKPGPSLSQIALPTAVRQEAENLVYRLKNWEQISQQGGEVPSGVMLYGPPGVGKTHLVQAIARELRTWHIFEVSGCEVVRDPAQFRKTVELALQHRPSIVFLDEADELLADRRTSISAGSTNEILKTIDGVGGKLQEVLFIGATNRIESIDAAALRGGRFGEKIYMGPLQAEDLENFLEREFKERSNVRFAGDLTPKTMASLLSQSTPASAVSILRKAVNYTLGTSEHPVAVTLAHVNRAWQSIGT